MWQRFTERSRKSVLYAQEEASRLGENYVSTEHLLLGLVREDGSSAAQILSHLGVPLERIRSEIARQVARGDGRPGQDMQLTPRAKKVIDLAYDESRQLNHDYIGTEHLLLGMIREGEGLAGRVLAKLGVSLESARQEAEAASDENETPSPNTTSQETDYSDWPSPINRRGVDWQRFTEQAKRVIFHSQEEANRLGGNWVSTEHLLLSLVGNGENVAVQLLLRLGVSCEQVREEIRKYALRAGGQAGQDTRLTIRAKDVLDFAFQEARDLGSYFIGTEHLLLGLIREGEGLAGQGLTALRLSLEGVRQEVRALSEGTEAVLLGTQTGAPKPPVKGETTMWQRFTERARKVVFYAQEEAGKLGENYVSTEHLLLGLIRENDSVAARVLDRMGIELGRIRSEIERQVVQGNGRLDQDMQLTPRAKRIIDLAYDEARQLNNNYIGSEHLLLGLIREGEGLAGRILTKLGVDVDHTRKEVMALQEGNEKSTTASATPGTKPPSQRMAPPRGRSPIADILTEHRLRGRDILGIEHLTREEIMLVLHVAARLKDNKFDATQTQFAQGQTLAMLFEKPSLRTRVTFEAGMNQMGGHAICLEGRLGVRETVPDVARNLDRWLDGIMARTFSHQTVVELAEYADIPVVNGLSDREHPCQAFADFQTLAERRGTLEGLKLAYVGDGNNVAHSLFLLAAKVGTHFSLSCPEGYEPDQELWQAALGFAAETGATLTLTHDPAEGVKDADAVYTDVWASMGQEDEAAARAVTFAPFQVNAALMAAAKPDALVMHCLPAHRGEEISADVLDGPHSVVFDQAENRLHAQKAVLALIL